MNVKPSKTSKSREGLTMSWGTNLLSKTQLQGAKLLVPRILRRAARNKHRMKAAMTPTITLPLTYQQNVNGEDLNPLKNVLQRSRKVVTLS